MAIRLDANRELFRPMPMHFSKCGAKRDAAMLRWQFGQTHSAGFLLFTATDDNISDAASKSIVSPPIDDRVVSSASKSHCESPAKIKRKVKLLRLLCSMIKIRPEFLRKEKLNDPG